MTGVKSFQSYSDQVTILQSRGMRICDVSKAADKLEQIDYYRLSGYWYPFRKKISSRERSDDFYEGTSFKQILSLYEFDERLRTVTFDAIAKVELMLRAMLGYALGQVDECAHLKPHLLNSRAQSRDTRDANKKHSASDSYQRWVNSYAREVNRSKEDFVTHHR